jgi:hypothetical protein
MILASFTQSNMLCAWSNKQNKTKTKVMIEMTNCNSNFESENVTKSQT